MKKVFVSYHHKEPDSALATSIVNELRNRGHDPFIDVEIEIGERWAQRIDSELRASSVFVVLLSEQSVVRDMVHTEVQIAYELFCADAQNLSVPEPERFQILPVRVGFEGDLPYNLAGWIGSLQYTLWRNADDTADIVKQIANAIEGDTLSEQPDLRGDSGVGPVQPQPVADIFLETGTLHESPFYIERDSEHEVMRNAQALGTTTIIHGARQMGKSSMLARILQHLSSDACYLDFQLADASRFASLDKLCQYVAAMLSRQVPGARKPADHWDDFLGPSQNLTDYLETQLLSTGNPFTILFDEVDRIAQFPDCLDFFPMLRAWHEQRATRANWENLNLLIAHSSDPNAWIEQQHQSPFNVGLRTSLLDFTMNELQDLSHRHGLALTESDGTRLMEMVGGHPYLTRLALFEISARDKTLDELEISATEESGPFADHLRHYFFRLTDRADLAMNLKRCISGLPINDSDAFRRLHAAGLVVGSGPDTARIRCDLYRRYFEQRL